jgi:hypothetical protein
MRPPQPTHLSRGTATKDPERENEDDGSRKKINLMLSFQNLRWQFFLIFY